MELFIEWWLGSLTAWVPWILAAIVVIWLIGVLSYWWPVVAPALLRQHR